MSAEGYTHLTEAEVQRLDELAELLQVSGLERAVGQEAVNGMFVQGALDDELFETRAEG